MLQRNSSCQHAVINAPADGRTAYLARSMRPGSLPHVLAGSASALDGFGTCSMFIRITACSLADSLFRSLLRRGLQTFHCFPARLGCYRLERKLPVGFTNSPTGVPRLSTAHKHGRHTKAVKLPFVYCKPLIRNTPSARTFVPACSFLPKPWLT